MSRGYILFSFGNRNTLFFSLPLLLPLSKFFYSYFYNEGYERKPETMSLYGEINRGIGLKSGTVPVNRAPGAPTYGLLNPMESPSSAHSALWETALPHHKIWGGGGSKHCPLLSCNHVTKIIIVTEEQSVSRNAIKTNTTGMSGYLE